MAPYLGGPALHLFGVVSLTRSCTAGEAGPSAAFISDVVPLSVLDLAPIGSGSTATAALAQSTAPARRAEELGFRRY